MKNLLIALPLLFLLSAPLIAGTVIIVEQPPTTSLPILGDINRDGTTSSLDIDSLYNLFGPSPDFIPDGQINIEDANFLIHNVFQTIRGDANLDRKVNNKDFGIIFGNFGHTNVGWGDGDFNADDIVDIEDFGFVFGNFGFNNTSTQAMEVVPEPSSFILILMGIISLFLCLHFRK